ncbi:hypothetical protein FSARC_7389 [Fusarium sarcochroum]|uniref:Uncharacterized protein n=1 Tax=Fusarium sarcochroum TaxID=1208366 RepID=A0A8H4X7C7_9HYPO|nr:hypothetical protein FSARC_7389 [Fusarium sarcochroum]
MVYNIVILSLWFITSFVIHDFFLDFFSIVVQSQFHLNLDLRRPAASVSMKNLAPDTRDAPLSRSTSTLLHKTFVSFFIPGFHLLYCALQIVSSLRSSCHSRTKAFASFQLIEVSSVLENRACLPQASP